MTPRSSLFRSQLFSKKSQQHVCGWDALKTNLFSVSPDVCVCACVMTRDVVVRLWRHTIIAPLFLLSSKSIWNEIKSPKKLINWVENMLPNKKCCNNDGYILELSENIEKSIILREFQMYYKSHSHNYYCVSHLDQKLASERMRKK